MILWLALAFGADDHTLAAPAAVAVQPVAPIPEGAPRTVDVAPGDDVDAVIATLPAGSTVHLLPGVHRAPIHLDRPLTLVGPADVEGPGVGSVIVVGAPDVTVKDLFITGSGTDANAGDAGIVIGGDRFRVEHVSVVHTFLGIDVRHANEGVIENCVVKGREVGPIGTHGDGIRLWEARRNRIVGNHLEHVRDMVVWYSEDNRIEHNTVEHSRYGVHFMHADGNTVVDNDFDHDVVGVFVMYSRGISLEGNTVVGSDGAAGMGMGFKESDDVTVKHNRLLASTIGLYLDSTPMRPDTEARIEDNLLAYNHVGLRFHGVHAGARILGDDFHENAVQVEVDGGVQATAVTFRDNRWSDYVGYDLDEDGYGDLPYAPVALSRAVVDRHPDAAFFDGTPAAFLLDLVGAAFPMWAPPALLTDPHPRLGALETR